MSSTWANRSSSTGSPAPAPIHPPVREIRLDGLVVLKVIQHCQEHFPVSVAGSLLGLDIDDVLEVTHR